MKKWILKKQYYLDNGELKKLRTYWEAMKELALKKGRTRNVKTWMLTEFALSTGLRAFEMCNVRVGDLVLKGDYPQVTVVKGKGNVRNKQVFISTQLAKDLKWYLNYKKTTLGEPVDADDYLFVTETKQQQTPQGLYYLWRNACVKSGIGRFKLHSARHSYATQLYKKTKNLRLVQKQLRHASIETTQVYADVMPEDIIAGVNELYGEKEIANPN